MRKERAGGGHDGSDCGIGPRAEGDTSADDESMKEASAYQAGVGKFAITVQADNEDGGVGEGGKANVTEDPERWLAKGGVLENGVEEELVVQCARAKYGTVDSTNGDTANSGVDPLLTGTRAARRRCFAKNLV